jgi:ribonuclease III
MPAAGLSDALGHVFADEALLRQALTHRSHSQPNNERLEFVGDGILNCVIALELYRRFPALPEGDLSRLRAGLVNQASLAALAERLDLGKHLLLGEGESRSGGAARPSILADALEALLGAVFIDAGFDRANAVALRVFRDSLEALDPVATSKDPKTLLQEHLQGRHLGLPAYRVTAIRGEAHKQEFEVECIVEALGVHASGTGSSRRSAEQVAARLAYERVAGA